MTEKSREDADTDLPSPRTARAPEVTVGTDAAYAPPPAQGLGRRTNCSGAATDAGLGTDLVVQTAYGDSGKTTFFIDDEIGWKRHRRDIIGTEVKVMKRINNRPVAVEASSLAMALSSDRSCRS